MSRIAYADDAGRVIVYDTESGAERDLSARGRAAVPDDLVVVDNWPTWSPDGARVAFTRLAVAQEEMQAAGIWVVGADGESSAEVFSATDAAPIYFAWAPDGARIAVLVQSGNTLALRVVDARAPRPPVTVAQGSPLYFAWCGDSRTIIAHVGSRGVSAPTMRHVLIRLSGGSTSRENLSDPPAAGYRAPAWSTRHGAMTLASEHGDGAAIVLRAAGDAPARTLVDTGPGPAFVWSPDGSWLAYASRNDEARDAYQGVAVVDEEGRSITLTDEPLLAYCWDLDSRRLVCFAGGVVGRLVHIIAVDVGTRESTDLGWARPSRDFWFMLGHFDQYSISTPLVSADGQHLALAASHAKDAENGVVPTVREILARPLNASGQDVRIGRGRIASWAPS